MQNTLRTTLRTLQSAVHDESGAIIILWGLLLTTLLGAVGLGLETTSWYSTQRDLQKASDSAAIAAAYAIGNANANYQALAQAEYTRMGLTNVSVTVNQPPKSGNYAGNSDAIEIIATENINTSFSQLVSSVSSVPISARSVVKVSTPAGSPTSSSSGSSSGSACVLALSNASSATVTFNGQINVNLLNCIIVSDSTSLTQGIKFNSNVAITSGGLYAVGGITTGSNDSINGFALIDGLLSGLLGSGAPSVLQHQTAIADPFSSLPIPSTSKCNYSNINNNSNSGIITLSPGVYCGGVSIDVGAILNPGTYVFTGGLSINSGASVTDNGSGVTLIFTGNSGGFSPNGSLSITAPSTGTYAGIAIYQDKADSSGINFNSGVSVNVTGIIYAPSSTVIFDSGATVNATCTKIVANTVDFNSAANFSMSACPSGYPTIAAGSSTTSTSASGETLVE